MDTKQQEEVRNELAKTLQQVQRAEQEAKNADQFYIDMFATLVQIIQILAKPAPPEIQDQVEQLVREIGDAVLRTSVTLPS